MAVFGPPLELAERIRTGDVAIDLYRPADLQLWWLATEIGRVSLLSFARGAGVLRGRTGVHPAGVGFPGGVGGHRVVGTARDAGELELGPLLDTPVRQLSLGQRMRGDLTAALLHDPAILYLDEPTIGLDVTSKAAVRAFLAEVNRDHGTTILLTTHDLDDVERLCRRVMVIDHGRLAFDGDLTALRARAAAERTLVVDLLAPASAIELPGARVVRVDGPRQWLAFPADLRAAPLVAAVMERYPVADISLREPDIDDVVARLYAESAPR